MFYYISPLNQKKEKITFASIKKKFTVANVKKFLTSIIIYIKKLYERYEAYVDRKTKKLIEEGYDLF